MKTDVEDRVRTALDDVSLRTRTLFIYKPPDDSRNWKPADYIVGWDRGIGFVEAKLCRTRAAWRVDLRPSQRRALRTAEQIDAPYLVAIWWAPRTSWAVIDWRKVSMARVSIAWEDAIVMGMNATERTLPMVLARGLDGELV
jgi:hypothetical protein